MRKFIKYIIMFIVGLKSLSEAVNTAESAVELDELILRRIK